ncbi:MAG: cytochrome P460 family protein, partial [Betaproteobacteria bacterium]|nr:cytochrome P460 family protein [Betaproteobacteria bacterium]
ATGAGWGDAIPELLRNGNWSYGLFTADRQARADVSYAECFACHQPKGATSYVFALEAIKAAK